MVHSIVKMAFGKASNSVMISADRRTQKEIGGNEALPPLWQEFKVLHDKVRYVDNNIYMGSWNRPLPGVRLGE